MKKILYYLKIIVRALLKITMAAMMGVSSGLGKSPMLEEKRDNKTIGANK